MPSVFKIYGWPNEHLLAVIGLPCKRKKSTKTRKPCSFLKLHSSEKERGR